MIEKNRLVEITGRDHVFDDAGILMEYASDMSFTNPVRPAYVVKPQNADQITQIVQVAVETETPLVPVSSGSPHFRGDTIPGTGGSVIVDMSDMKRIIHIDRKNRVAMFEPGVTFGELSAAVAKEGMRLNMPLLPRQSKSVLGSMLEREPVMMPKYHWDISDPLACTEVIFGTGDQFRTGAAAGSGSIEEQWAAGGAQKEAAGPSASSWYRLIQGAQGTMGIVTWASARCELIPALEEPYFVGSSSLGKIMDLVHWLNRLRLVNECLVLNSTNVARIVAASGSDEYLRIKDGLPGWILFFNIAAYDFIPEERMKGQREDVQELAQRLGMEPVRMLSSISADRFLKLVQKPSNEPYWKLNEKGGCEDIFFLTLNDKLEDMVGTMYAAAEAVDYPGTDIGVYIQPIVQGVNCHCEFNLFYDDIDAWESENIGNLSVSATKQLLSQGAFFSRPYGQCTGLIMNRDAATVDSLKKVKAIVDPLNIMNPGKLCF